MVILKNWVKQNGDPIGYPRPQGNLPNFEFGTNTEQQEKERGEWLNVLQSKKKELFRVPMSKNYS